MTYLHLAGKPLEVIFDAWIIGDRTLKSVGGELTNMRDLSRMKDSNIQIPYLYEYYNVHIYTQIASVGVKSVMARVLNALMEGVNHHPWLRRFLIVMLDTDLIAEFDLLAQENLHKDFTRVLSWFTKQVNIVIRQKQLQISEKVLGAVYGQHPKVIYIKALRRAAFYPPSTKIGRICVVRTKFNEALNDAVA